MLHIAAYYSRCTMSMNINGQIIKIVRTMSGHLIYVTVKD
jgi:hypothetical protein